ncbi:hypothetical protein D3C72_1560040 [compost metagenome]
MQRGIGMRLAQRRAVSGAAQASGGVGFRIGTQVRRMLRHRAHRAPELAVAEMQRGIAGDRAHRGAGQLILPLAPAQLLRDRGRTHRAGSDSELTPAASPGRWPKQRW